MNKHLPGLRSGLLKISRATLTRIQDNSLGTLREDPNEVSQVMRDDPEVALALDKASASPFRAEWDLDSNIIQNLGIITATFESLHFGDFPALENVEISFKCQIFGERDDAVSDICAGILPVLSRGDLLFTFSLFEDYECELH